MPEMTIIQLFDFNMTPVDFVKIPKTSVSPDAIRYRKRVYVRDDLGNYKAAYVIEATKHEVKNERARL